MRKLAEWLYMKNSRNLAGARTTISCTRRIKSAPLDLRRGAGLVLSSASILSFDCATRRLPGYECSRPASTSGTLNRRPGRRRRAAHAPPAAIRRNAAGYENSAVLKKLACNVRVGARFMEAGMCPALVYSRAAFHVKLHAARRFEISVAGVCYTLADVSFFHVNSKCRQRITVFHRFGPSPVIMDRKLSVEFVSRALSIAGFDAGVSERTPVHVAIGS
ncbi:hypothetical protein EVAR_44085_1 [Eumeta japonica]|uniref:Uncharacterized protein n=1 Tax=Eumeta variegata TaxID=151549 RepID=A0A4C1X0I9_EUMVA|nr:hypothetical protein EVAR_44085_1 [Eumeta japonica]